MRRFLDRLLNRCPKCHRTLEFEANECLLYDRFVCNYCDRPEDVPPYIRKRS